MSDFIIFDDADENWKNSEVMKIFVENYMKAKMAEKKDDLSSPTNSAVVISDNKNEAEQGSVDSNIKLAMQAEVNNILYQLDELAQESGDNEKATLMIEVAALKIKDLLNGDDDEV